MKNLRSLIGTVLAFALTAFAAPGIAGNKLYSLQLNQSSVASGASVPLRATFTNVSPTGGANSSFNSVRLDAPNGYVITQVTGKKSGVASIVQNGNAIEVTYMSPVGKNDSFWIDFNVTTPTTCGAGEWNINVAGDVWSGSQLSGSTFERQGAAPTTSATGTLSLAFDTSSFPPSFVEDSQFTVRVNQQSSCSGTTLPSVTVTLTGTGASFTGSTVTGSGSISLTGTFNDISNSVTLTASATGYQPVTTGVFKVFASGELDCAATAPSPGGTGYFATLPSGVATVTDIGYAAGYRSANDKTDPCDKLNYTFTNNIGTVAAPGAAGATDNVGNILPANAVSMVWDTVYEPNAVFTYTLTFLPEYVDPSTGLPGKKTKFCKLNATPPTDCRLAANQQNLQACVDTALTALSIPGADPACVAEEAWATIAASECTAAGIPNPNAPNAAPACIRVINRIIDARDPPIIR